MNNKAINNIKANLDKQVQRIFFNVHEGSIKTRYRYKEAEERFTGFLAYEFRLQKISNVKEKHIAAYIEYMKIEGKASSTIKTDISAIKYFHRHTGSRSALPGNDQFDIPSRTIGAIDRAWNIDEISAAIVVAKGQGREDVVVGIKLGHVFGMRLEEACRCTVNHIKNAQIDGDLYIKGKNGQVRYLHIKNETQRDLVKEVLRYAAANGRTGDDKILSDNIKGSTLKEKNSIQNWITNHRDKFQDKSRENKEWLEILRARAAGEGVKLRTETISFHGLRYYFAQDQYRRYREGGYSEYQSRIRVSEDLGHHREQITRIYLSDTK